MGRPPKLVDMSTKHFTREEIKQRKEREKNLQVNRDKMLPPEWLNDRAKEEFKRVVDELDELNILDNLDVNFIALYSETFTRVIDICEELQKTELITCDEKGNKVYNKTRYDLQKALDKEKNIIMQCSTKLGLATIDRLKIVINKQEEKEENPYLKFLK